METARIATSSGLTPKAFEIRSAMDGRETSSSPGFCVPIAIARRSSSAARPMLLMGTLK